MAQLPMILWNFAFGVALFTRCACVIYKLCIRREPGRLTIEERTRWRSVRNSRRNHHSYGTIRAKSEPLVCREISRRREKTHRSERSDAPPLALRITVGRSHAGQNDPRGENRPGFVCDVSWKFYFDRRRRLRADAALHQ